MRLKQKSTLDYANVLFVKFDINYFGESFVFGGESLFKIGPVDSRLLGAGGPNCLCHSSMFNNIWNEE